jgi:protein involved in polysaccharide export with SLBB domain
MRKNQLTGFIRRERRVIGRVARFTIVWLLALSLGCLSCVRLRGRAPVPETVSTAGALTTGFAVEPDSMPEYRFGYGDIIEVKFFYNPTFDETLTIRPDGRITLPRMGDVLVVGMTAAQLDELITEKYSEIIREPDVTVILREIGEQVVYVLGEVNKPGGYPLNPNGTTVLGAIAMAQGFMPTAKLSSVIIINKDIYGVPVASRLNLTRAVGGRGRENDPFLQGNEIVYVPATFITQLNQFVDQFFTKMISPFEFYLKGYDALHPDKRWRY